MLEAILLSEARTASGNPDKEESEMNRAWKRFLTVSVVAVALMTSMASLALAAPESATNPPAAQGQAPSPRAVLAYIAGKANVDMKTLMEEFKAGKTLQEICAAHGIDWSVIEAVFKPNEAKREENKQKAIQRLEKHVADLLKRQAELQDHVSKLEDAIAKLEAKIPEIQNETLKGFAVRHLEIMRQRMTLANPRLEIIGKQLSLARDELEYFKSL